MIITSLCSIWSCRPTENVLHNGVKCTRWHANCCSASPNPGAFVHCATLCLHRFLWLMQLSLFISELTCRASTSRSMYGRITRAGYHMRCKHATRFSFCLHFTPLLLLQINYKSYLLSQSQVFHDDSTRMHSTFRTHAHSALACIARRPKYWRWERLILWARMQW